MHLLNKSVQLNRICDWKYVLNEPRVNLSWIDFKDFSSREEEEVAWGKENTQNRENERDEKRQAGREDDCSPQALSSSEFFHVSVQQPVPTESGSDWLQMFLLC